MTAPCVCVGCCAVSSPAFMEPSRPSITLVRRPVALARSVVSWLGWREMERPYVVRPNRLYTRDDLMQGWHRGADHSMTLDGRIYDYVKAHGGRAPDMEEGLAQRTHDHFIDVALADFLMASDRPV